MTTRTLIHGLSSINKAKINNIIDLLETQQYYLIVIFTTFAVEAPTNAESYQRYEQL